MVTNPLFILSVLAFNVALSEWLARRTWLRRRAALAGRGSRFIAEGTAPARRGSPADGERTALAGRT